MTTIGFLHTADVHVGTFHARCAELAPDARDLHVVDPALLSDAGANGVTPGLVARLDDRLRELAGDGARVIVCTCSTLGLAAESRSLAIGRPVLRADRPMAEAAVAAGRRIAVLVAVESTLEPTLDLLRESATRAGVPVTLLPKPCLPAWRLFAAGDHDGYARAIATRAREVAPAADVVVLAQASMAPAAELLADLPVPVLTSPRAAVARALLLQ